MKSKLACGIAGFIVTGMAYGSATDLIQGYQNAGAGCFSATGGWAAWEQEHRPFVGVDARSCASCHGTDLSLSGRHIKTGKPIEPMTLSVNSARLTDRKKVEKWFRRNCRWTLGRECTPQRKLGPKAVDVLVEILLDKASQASRASAAQKLGLIGDPRAAGPLIQVLNDAGDDPTVRNSAAHALGSLNTPAAVDAMLAALTDKEALVQWGAATGLGRTGNPQVLGPLAEQFGSEHFYVRSTAASSIKWIVGVARRDKLEIQGSLGPIALRLIPLLKDEDPQVREAAAETLGTLGDRRAYEPVKSLLQDEVSSVRAAAAGALHDLPGPQTGEGLVERLGDESSKVREAAASALGGVINAEAVEALIATLSNAAEEWAIRQQAAWSLGESGDSRAVDALLVAARPQCEYQVSSGARGSLKQVEVPFSARLSRADPSSEK